MYRKEDIPKRIRLAILMLIALLMLSLQQQVMRSFFSDDNAHSPEVENQLILKQGSDTVANFGIVQDDSQLAFALLLAFSFLFFIFPVLKGPRVVRFSPVPLSRNFSCIVPKGP